MFTTSARKEFSNDEDLDSLIEAEESGTTFSSLEETLSGVVIAGPQPGTVTRDGRYFTLLSQDYTVFSRDQ